MIRLQRGVTLIPWSTPIGTEATNTRSQDRSGFIIQLIVEAVSDRSFAAYSYLGVSGSRISAISLFTSVSVDCPSAWA